MTAWNGSPRLESFGSARRLGGLSDDHTASAAASMGSVYLDWSGLCSFMCGCCRIYLAATAQAHRLRGLTAKANILVIARKPYQARQRRRGHTVYCAAGRRRSFRQLLQMFSMAGNCQSHFTLASLWRARRSHAAHGSCTLPLQHCNALQLPAQASSGQHCSTDDAAPTK